jgi:hypothetical protein
MPMRPELHVEEAGLKPEGPLTLFYRGVLPSARSPAPSAAYPLKIFTTRVRAPSEAQLSDPDLGPTGRYPLRPGDSVDVDLQPHLTPHEHL